MGVLMWDKPKQVMSRDEYEAISADGAPPGVYSGNMSRDEYEAISADGAPPGVYSGNMSREDAYKWKARKIGGKNPRVEIRKSLWGPDPVPGPALWHGQPRKCHAQVLIIVTKDQVRMSQNGPAVYDAGDWGELIIAVQEARLALA